MNSRPESEFSIMSQNYICALKNSFSTEVFACIELLAMDLEDAWIKNKKLFICGNGGSAANALHLANDFHYGVGACGNPIVSGLRVEALNANVSILTCLANDIGYQNVFSHQLEVNASPGDLLLVLSGSGNSENIVRALKTALSMNLRTHAILAFDGGKCLDLAQNVVHFPINDMQIAEDTQLLIGHICMQWLSSRKPTA